MKSRSLMDILNKKAEIVLSMPHGAERDEALQRLRAERALLIKELKEDLKKSFPSLWRLK